MEVKTRYPRLYNKQRQLITVLENAVVSLDALKMNDLSIATFMLPNNDPKNDLCQDRYFVELFDGDQSVGWFRIVTSPESDEQTAGEWISYEVEHAIITLIDDFTQPYEEYGGTGITTGQVIQFILAKQSVTRWQLGTCAFTQQLQYKWEKDDLLSSLMSIAKPLTDYHWTYDFTTWPWTVNLVALSTVPTCEVRFRKNMKQVKRKRDGSKYCTKLYCYGYGEGVNQLTVASVNGGLPYLLADNFDPADPACGTFTDTSIEDAFLLKELGKAALNMRKTALYTYTISAIDLFRMTGIEWDRFSEGKLLRVYDGKDSFNARIVQVTKPDPEGDPGNITLTISNNDADVSDTLSELANRAKITALYSQGATNVYAQQFADNADPDHPAKMRVYVPREAVQINKMLLSWDTEKFRAYSKSAASGGGSAVTTGQSSKTTTTQTDLETTAPNTLFTDYSGEATLTGPAADTERTGGPSTTYTGNNPSGTSVVSLVSLTEMVSGQVTDKAVGSTGGPSTTNTGNNPSGSSVVSLVSLTEMVTGQVTNEATGNTDVPSTGSTSNNASGVSISYSGSTYDTAPTTGNAGDGATGAASDSSTTYSGTGTTGGSRDNTGSTVGTSSHYHYMYHSHTGPSHYHSLPHTHSGPSHWHTVSLHHHDMTHSHTLPQHTHGLNSHVHGLASHTHTINYHQHGMNHTHELNQHVHSLNGHTHGLGDHTHTIVYHQHGMNHTHELNQHVHSLNGHTHSLGLHQHPFNHLHQYSHTHGYGHSHNISHTHDLIIGAHSHGINYGIYEGNQASASNVVIRVDGTAVPAGSISQNELDITPWLGKDTEGKIKRGEWHVIELVPDAETRIEANLFAQVFIQSVGGGNY